jgi:hypothetical protein
MNTKGAKMRIELDFKTEKKAHEVSPAIIAENQVSTFSLAGFTTLILETDKFHISKEDGLYYIAVCGGKRILAKDYLNRLTIDNEVLLEE